MLSEYNKEEYEQLFSMQNLSRDEGKDLINTVLEHVGDTEYDMEIVENIIVNLWREDLAGDDLDEYKQSIVDMLERL